MTDRRPDVKVLADTKPVKRGMRADEPVFEIGRIANCGDRAILS
jgi:hypothetical protein